MAKAGHAERRVYCSHKCKGEARTKAVLEERKCGNCGLPFLVQPYRKVENCSEACSRASMRKSKRKHEGGWYVQKTSGYVIRGERNRTILQHREIMEKIIGRPLKAFENVHHRNGVKADNRPENLEIWITKQPKGQRPEDLIEWAIAILEYHGYKVVAPSGASPAP